LDPLRDWLDSLDPQLKAHVLQILRLSAWLVILAVVFIPLERLFALRPMKIFRKGIVTDVGYYFLNGIVPALVLSSPLALVAWWTHRLLPAGFISMVVGLPLWARLFAGMVAGEVGYYWGHRWSHEIPLLWRFHAVHHSAEEVDYLVSTRAHPVDIVFSRLCEFTPMYVLGLASPVDFKGSLVPVLVTVIGTLWGFFIHANVNWRFGPLEWLISTPAFHHWHHTNDGPEVINKNYAPLLPWVDWLFGSLYLPKDKQPERYGINQPMSPILFGQLVEPFMVWRRPSSPAVSVAPANPVEDTSVGVVPTAQS
jgi:sterol desaturase/sphingolipid hydroxylase (fatty acid hydroxylase superfamily)